MADDRGIPRREFLKAAVAIGGASAFSACLGREDVDVPTGPDDLSTLPERQHAWESVLDTDEAGNTLPPRHHVVLLLEYGGGGEPKDADRRIVEEALRGLERAYERSNEGLLFTIGYSPAYFERFGEGAAPAGVDLPDPEALAPFEDPAFDTPDAVVHLASDHAQVVLGAEEALRGEVSELNGVTQPEAPLADVFEFAERRTGFVGAGLPAEHDDVAGVPDDAVSEEAPLFMGFKSNYEKTQATEDRVTIRQGPFAEGTTQHLSKIRLNLEQWYEQDSRFQREAKMFCPHHAQEGKIEGVGDNLGTDPNVDECGDVTETTRSQGVVGHSQKMVSARDDDGPIILRRDFDSTDDDRAGLHFLSLQREISDFVKTREAMNGTDLTENSPVGQRNNNGILQYMSVERRGNYLLPPRRRRSLPVPDPETTEELASEAA